MPESVKEMRKVQFSELIEFMTVVEYRSFTRAATALGISTAAVSQTIRAAESRFGLRLLNRTTRHVEPTPAGERLLERLRPVMKELQSALEELNEYRDKPFGYLRLAITPLAIHVLSPLLVRFANHYPDIKIEVSADDDPVDIDSGHFDAGIRLGAQVANDMVAVPVGDAIQRVVVGAPTYFDQHSPPRTPEELSQHNCVRIRIPSGRIDPWRFARGDWEFTVPVDGSIVFDDVELALRAALSGGGLLYLPESYAKAAIAAGGLQKTLEAWMPKPSDRFILWYPSRRHNPAALRCLVGFLRQNLRRERLDINASAPSRLLCA